jgi:hypothetical protein
MTAPAAKAPVDHAAALQAEMARIAAHATSVETLRNGAKLYHLAGGREVEQAPGKTPYVVAKGTPVVHAAAPATSPGTSTAGATGPTVTAAPATPAPATDPAGPSAGTTSPTTP